MWRQYYLIDTGRPTSLGTVFGPTPPRHAFIEFVEKPLDSDMWDEATLSFIPRPPKILIDRWEDLLADPDFAPGHSQVPSPFRAGLERAIQNIMGNERFRNVAETKEIGGKAE